MIAYLLPKINTPYHTSQTLVPPPGICPTILQNSNGPTQHLHNPPTQTIPATSLKTRKTNQTQLFDSSFALVVVLSFCAEVLTLPTEIYSMMVSKAMGNQHIPTQWMPIVHFKFFQSLYFISTLHPCHHTKIYNHFYHHQ